MRALVLDGAVDPDTPSLQGDITQAQGFGVAFASFTAWCQATSGCPLGGRSAAAAGSAAQAAAHAVATVQALVTRANATPLANQLDDGQPADGAMLVTGIAAALYSKAYWPDLKTALASAFGGNGTVLVELANLLAGRNPDGTYSNLVDAETAIDCLDRPWPRALATWQAAARDLASGVLLGWNGDGHTAYGQGSACVDTIVNDYLIDLAVPRSGTVCT